MSERVWGRPVPTAVAGFLPDHAKRAQRRRWTVALKRRGAKITIVLTAPSVVVASLSMLELEAAVRAYVRTRGEGP